MYEDQTNKEGRFARTSGEPKPHLVDASATPNGRQWTRDREVKLSILMPAYNEARYIDDAIQAVLATRFPFAYEVIVVNDGSDDATGKILDRVEDDRIVAYHHPRNMGKGAALHTAAAVASGTHIVPFDADLEYSPADLIRMMEPVIEGRYDVVYGTRLFGANTMYQSYRHAMGNRALTLAANLMFDSYIRDMHTCLKLLPLDLFRQMQLSESGFGLDTEITAKILKMGIRPFEVPVTYHSRSVEHGKKITWRDGVECLQVLARVRLRKPQRHVVAEPPPSVNARKSPKAGARRGVQKRERELAASG